MINEVHPEFQRKFRSREELDGFKRENGIQERGVVSKQHINRVKDFVMYCKEQKAKNPNWKYKGQYPGQRGKWQKER